MVKTQPIRPGRLLLLRNYTIAKNQQEILVIMHLPIQNLGKELFLVKVNMLLSQEQKRILAMPVILISTPVNGKIALI